MDFSVATGQIAIVRRGRMVNSGTNAVQILTNTEDNVQADLIANVASAAGTSANIPNIGSAATSAGNLINSVGLVLAPGMKLTYQQTGAGAQNDTARIIQVWELYNLATEPTISKARSTNAADVTQGTDAISDANDLQEFVC